MNQPITYSSEITLSLAKFNNIYLYSDGFMQTQLELNSFHKLHGNLFNDFKNAVFKVIPVINFKWTERILLDVVENEFTKLQTQALVKDRKAIVLGYLSNLDGEVNSNISLNQKMKATPLVFSSSQFHLVHTSSLKFLSLNDENIENLFFELVDFPCQGSILKFVPCLAFQKLRTNSVYNGDPVIITSARTVCNRAPQLCTTYKGFSYENQMLHPDETHPEFLKELVGSRTWASVEDHSRWRVNAFYAAGQHDKQKSSEDQLRVGDVITLNLSEMNQYLNVLKPYDTFEKILDILNKEDDVYDEDVVESEVQTINTQKQNINKINTMQINSNHPNIRTNQTQNSLISCERKPSKVRNENQGDQEILKKILIEDVVLAFQDIQSQNESLPAQKTMIVIPNSCYWKIESEKFQEGGRIAWDKKYRFRHFQTGRYLKLTLNEKQTTIAELTSEASNDTLFKFCPIQNAELHQGKFLWKDSFFYVLHIKTNKYVGITDEDEVQDTDQIKYAQKELNLELSAVYLSVIQNHFNTYRMKRIEFQDTWETSMLLYSLPFFMDSINFMNLLNKNIISQVGEHNHQTLEEISSKIHFYQIHKRLFSTLDNFIAFINNKMISNISINQEYNMIVPNRQNVSRLSKIKIMRQQQVFPLLCWLLFRAFPVKEEMEKIGDVNYNSLMMDFQDENDFMISAESFLQNGTIYEHTKALERLDQHHIKRKLLISYKIYMTIKEICSLNSENQICLIKFINILQKHIGFGEEVIETLISGFSNNEKILQSLAQMEISQNKLPANDVNVSQAEGVVKVNLNVLVGLVQKILEFPSFSRPDIICFLSNICFYNEDPLFVNQDIILRSLVQDEQVSQKALMKITNVDQRDLYLEYLDRDNITQCKSLPEFLDESNQDHNPNFQKQYNYLKNQLDLFANLCLHRNVVACQTFCKTFELNILTKYGLSDKFDNEFKAIFQRLIRAIYIDREPFAISKKPDLVRIVNYDKNVLTADIIHSERYLLFFKRRINITQNNLLKSMQLSVCVSSQQQTPYQQGENTFMKQKFNLMDEEVERPVLQEGENLKQFLNEFKHELLQYIQEKYDLLCNNCPSYKVYNVLTYEIIKILELIIKFGLFSVKLEKPNLSKTLARSKSSKKIQEMDRQKQIEDFQKQMKNTDMEKLISYLSFFLEYDENYFLALNTAKLERKHIEQRKNKEDIQQKRGMSILKNIGEAGQQLKALKLLFINNKPEKKEKRNISAIIHEGEITSDPLFKKIRSLKKILQNSINKTFSIREENNSTNFEVLIKIEVCRIFSYLLDVKQDQLVDNMVGFFQTVFIPKLVNNQGDAKNIDLKDQYISLLPEDQLEIGQEFDIQNKRPLYIEALPIVRNFDFILERPFYETLIFALYFSSDSRLQNEIVNLIQQYSSQKQDFLQNVRNLQLMLAPEVRDFYKDWNIMLERMKQQILKCQSWLQMGTPAKQNQINEGNMKISITILEEIKNKFHKNYLDTRALKTKQKIFIHVGTFNHILFLMRNCQRMIDTQPKVFLFQSTDDQAFKYQIQLGESIMKILILIMDIFCIFYKNNFQNQILIQKKIIPLITPYSYNNFGQVPFLLNLYKDNPKIVLQMDTKLVFKFVVDLIQKHGRYPEFLEIFNVILASMEDLNTIPELPKSLLTCLMSHNSFEQLNPFGETVQQTEEFHHQSPNSVFYSHEPDLKAYKTKFLVIVSRCLKIEVSVNQIQQVKAHFSMRDILIFILEIMKDQVIDPSSYHSFHMLMVKTALIEIIMILVSKISSSLGDLIQQVQLVQEFIELEIQSMVPLTTFSIALKVYLFNLQLPLILMYIEAFFLDASTQLFGASQTQKKDRKRLYIYGQTFMKVVNFMTSKEIMEDSSKCKNLTRLCSILTLDLLPSYLLKPENEEDDIMATQGPLELSHLNDDRVHDQFDAKLLDSNHDEELKNEAPDIQLDQGKGFRSFLSRFRGKFKKVGIPDSALNERQGREFLIDDDSKKMMDYWNVFVEGFMESNSVNSKKREEQLSFSNSLWNVSQMFQSDVKGDQKDLLLVSEDIILKLLYFIEYWQQNKGDKKQVIFVLQVLYKILKVSRRDLDELKYRQQIYDNLNATKILMTLLWNENEVDHDYLKHILKLFNMLLYGGNIHVQKTIYDYVLSYTECEKFFYKINSIITWNIKKEEGSIQVACITKTLRLIQLLCQGHNLDLQNYLHHQKNSKNNYDIVVMCVRLLHGIKISRLNYKIVIQCLATINETMQGPCRNNQTAVGNSKYLEFALSILSEDERVFELKLLRPRTPDAKIMTVLMSEKAGEKFKKLKGTQKILKEHSEHQKTRPKLMNPEERYCISIHPGNLARLKYKSVIGIVGLLEASDGGDILMLRIIRTIPLNVLTENLLYIFKLYMKYKMKDEYEYSLFNREHYTIDPTQNDDFYELIIEQGFLIYGLMQMLLASKKGRDILHEDVDMRDILNVFEQESQDKKSLFGSLGKLRGLMASRINNIKMGLDNALKSDEEKKKEEDAQRKQKKKEALIEAINFFKMNTKSVEVFRVDKVYTVYFPKLPFCHMLPKDLKDEFHENVQRTNSKSKITYLMLNSEQFILTMRHEERLRILFNYSPILGMFADNGKLWENLSFINVITINLIVCASYSQYFISETGVQVGDPNYADVLLSQRLYDPRFLLQENLYGTKNVILIFGLIELVLSSLIVFFFLLKRAPLKIFGVWQNFDFSSLGFLQSLYLVIYKILKSLFILLQDFDILYYSIYILAGIVGLTVHPFLFAIHLMDFFKLDNLKTVVKAIWQPRVELGIVLMLLMIFEYYFTITAWILFYTDYDPLLYLQGDLYNGADQAFCTEFWLCYIQTFNWTFKFTGSIGTHLTDPNTITYEGLTLVSAYDNVDAALVNHFIGRFVFDNVFNICLVFILTNMIQGIIIDTFGALREKLAEKVNDQKYLCFVCGFNMEKLDKKSDTDKGFGYHIVVEHYMWNYLFYRAYIEQKNPLDCDGNESYVQNKLKESDLNWFPIGRAKCVVDEDDEDALKDHIIHKLNQKTTKLDDKIGKVELKGLHIREQLILQYESTSL